jgi:dUTP pyrophosphatase
MQKVKIKILRLVDSAKLPRYEHEDDSGLDLFALEEQEIPSGEAMLIGTGISIELPQGTEAQIRPRSGLALKHSITVLNTPGTVDAGYRGEIRVILINHGKHPFKVLKGMKIAQMVIAPVIRAEIEEVDSLSKTLRGEGGFGSTGV